MVEIWLFILFIIIFRVSLEIVFQIMIPFWTVRKYFSTFTYFHLHCHKICGGTVWNRTNRCEQENVGLGVWPTGSTRFRIVGVQTVRNLSKFLMFGVFARNELFGLFVPFGLFDCPSIFENFIFRCLLAVSTPKRLSF